MGCQYVALSYVWGDPPVSGSSSTSAPDFTNGRNHFDKIIEDALVVTQELGFFYLWVNKICINQKDDIDKSQQMGQMDLIYANATLTIIVAAGAGPDYGLPGINGTPRVEQQRFHCKGWTILTTLPSGKHTLQASKWYMRGWTYQESALFKRRLIFTDTQMLFECNGMHCTEVLEMDLDLLHNYKKGKINASTWRRAAISPKTPGLDPREFMDHVKEYSRRKLTYRSDALNAFRGILNIFEKAKRPVYSFWGLPIFLNDIDLSRGSTQMKTSWSMSTRFAFHLFWSLTPFSHQGLIRGQASFPGWSWAGWEGPVSGGYYEARDYLDDVRVSFEDNHGDKICLDDIDFDSRPPSLQDRYSSAIYVEGWAMAVHVMDHRQLRQESQSKGHPHEWKEGIYVCFSTKSYGPVFSKLESHDHLFTCAPDRTFMAFLPAPKQDARFHRTILLENVAHHYERVGIFKAGYGWRWCKSGKPEQLGWKGKQCWTEQDECQFARVCFKLR